MTKAICGFCSLLIIGCEMFASPISSAAAGAESGGGGNAVVCRNATSQGVISAELQDLFEARVQYNMHIPISSAPYTDQLSAMFNKVHSAEAFPTQVHWISPKVPDEREHYLTQITLTPPTLLPSNVELGDLNDAQPTIVPKGCKLERLAYFDDSFGRLYVNSEIWNSLNETNRAALYLHENIYMLLRYQHNETTSTRTRYYVGLIASDATLVSLFSGIPAGSDVYNCESEQSDRGINSGEGGFGFLALRTPLSNKPGFYDYNFYFYDFDGMSVISKTSLHFIDKDLSQVLNAETPSHEIITIIDSDYGPHHLANVRIVPDSNNLGYTLKMRLTDGFYPHSTFERTVGCSNAKDYISYPAFFNP